MKAWVAILAVVLAASCSPLSSSATIEERCEIARTYLASQIDQLGDEELVFAVTVRPSLPLGQNGVPETDEMARESAQTPWTAVENGAVWKRHTGNETLWSETDIQLFADYLRQDPKQNAVEVCPSIQELLTYNRIDFGDEAVAAALDDSVSTVGRHRKTISTLYLPVVDQEAGIAILEDGRQAGWLSGVGVYVKLEQDPENSWKAVGIFMSWIS